MTIFKKKEMEERRKEKRGGNKYWKIESGLNLSGTLKKRKKKEIKRKEKAIMESITKFSKGRYMSIFLGC